MQIHTLEDYDNYINKLQQIYNEIEYIFIILFIFCIVSILIKSIMNQ